MALPLRVLILEDVASDAEMMVRELRRAGFDPDWRRVDTEQEYLARLSPVLDVILADYRLPGFDALRALELLRERGLDIPFIVVSGTIGDEFAANLIKEGAADYILKDRLARLGQAVARALEKKRLREEITRAELALKASEARFRELLESAPDATVIVGANGCIALVNSQTESLFGYSRDELLGKPVEMLLPERARKVHVGHRVNYAADPRRRLMGTGLALAGRRKDGREFPAEVSLSPLNTPDGLVITSAIRDITERKRLEEQLRLSQKLEAVGRLAGGVAHDFNNLLTAILGYTAVLEEQFAEGPVRDDLEEIRKAAERAAGVTRQLLAFSRKQVLQPTVMDLNVVVADMDRMLRRLIGEDIDLVTTLGSALKHVKADQGQIEQVILNLAVNARDAMPTGGRLTLETTNIELHEDYVGARSAVPRGRYVLLAVSDTGVGITPEIQSHIFEPFFTTKERDKGTGLGLSTVYGIVKQSGGYIWVYSEPGRGSTFKIYLPAVEEPVHERGKTPSDDRPAHGTETILLVEDDQGVRTLACHILRQYGYTVIEAKDGETAIEAAGRHRGEIDLLLTDVVMPQMSGRELHGLLATRSPGLAVLYMSGYTDNAIVHHGVLEEGTAFLQKPFTPKVLAQRVRDVLDRLEH